MSWSDGAIADGEMRWLDRLFRRRIKGHTDKERTGGRIEERKTDCIGLHVRPTIHTHILAGCCMAQRLRSQRLRWSFSKLQKDEMSLTLDMKSLEEQRRENSNRHVAD